MAATIASAQTIQFVFVTKQREYTQTSTANPALIANPYSVGASIDGTALTSGYPISPTVAVQNGLVTTITLDPPSPDNWSFKSGGYAGQTSLNLDYGSGNYTYQSASFSNIILNLSNADLYPNAPKATITTDTTLGFQWIGNVLEVNPGLFNTLTITSNTFAVNFSSSSNHIGIFGNNFTSNVGDESFNSATPSLFVDIPAATFLGGSANKSIGMEFNNLIDQISNIPTTGAQSISAFTSSTSFNIQVIPEPSTYAAILGALALAGVMLRRRRRTAT